MLAAQGDDRLHRTLAEGGRADDRRPAVILERAGHDLGRGRRAFIDQYNDRFSVGQIAAARVIALRVFGPAATGGDDLAAGKEIIGDGDRLVQEAARVVPQVDDV